MPVHVAHLVLGLPMGGTEGLVDQMLRNPAEGYRVSVICLDELGLLGERAIRDGYFVWMMPRGEGINWSLPSAIAKRCRENSIDILHCHHYTPWFYGVLSRLFYPRLRIIFTEHGRLHPDLPSLRKRLFNMIMVPFTSGFTAVSPATSSALQRVEWVPGYRIEIIYNGVDGRRFEGLPHKGEIRQKLGLREDTLYFALCSRLDPVKWIDGLLEAIRQVVAEVPNCGLLLVGDGTERRRIEDKVLALGLSDRVVMPGYQANIAEWLKAADVFVLSSLSEGTSVSLIESMAAGIPAVVTRVGGNEYVVVDGVTGSLVPPGDVTLLAAGLLRFALDAKLREECGRAASRRFGERFTLHRMLDQYAALYRKIAGEVKN